jgi:hypothetical protein
MTADDFRLLSDQYRNGNHYLVISSGAAQLVGTREEANALVSSNAPAVAFRVNDLTAGLYVNDQDNPPPAEKAEQPYRKVGQPHDGNPLR